MNDVEYYASALERVKVARELRSELLRACPGTPFVRASIVRANVAARAALRTACEIIEHNPPRDWDTGHFAGWWAGMIEAAMKIISAVETEMYDPRAYPERYGIRVDSESGSD